MREILCHKDSKFRYTTPAMWREEHGVLICTYCGSISPETLKQMIFAEAKVEQAEWKYGWPHKFIVYHTGSIKYKWANEHLLDVNDREFSEFANLLEHASGIRFSRVDGKLLYKITPTKHEERPAP